MGEQKIRVIGSTELPTGFSTVSAGRKFQSASNWNKADAQGRMITGTLLQVNTRVVMDPRTKVEKTEYSYIFSATEPGTTIDQELNDVAFEAGEEILVYGTGHLNMLMKKVKVGDEIAINYLGKQKGRDGVYAHVFGFAQKK